MVSFVRSVFGVLRSVFVVLRVVWPVRSALSCCDVRAGCAVCACCFVSALRRVRRGSCCFVLAFECFVFCLLCVVLCCVVFGGACVPAGSASSVVWLVRVCRVCCASACYVLCLLLWVNGCFVLSERWVFLWYTESCLSQTVRQNFCRRFGADSTCLAHHP